jgi:hypothetical protein
MIVGSESARVPEDLDPSSDKPYRRIVSSIISVLIVSDIVAFLTSHNVGSAELQFMRDLHFSETVYRIGSGMFYLGYVLSEIPMNLSALYAGCREGRKQVYSPVC